MSGAVMLEAAIAYAARGWPVFPCAARGKVPLTEHGVKDASADPDVIRHWWEATPDANIGIATGGAFVVIDVDGEAGGESLRALVNGSMPPTPTSRTGRGMHLLFAVPEGGLGNRVAVRPGLDVRGAGGYIVAPPSVHASGHVYGWQHGPETPLAPVPAPILELLRSREAGAPAPPVEGRIPAGERNATLASLAGTMRRRAMTREEISVALRAVNKARCNPPLADHEVDGIAASVERYPAAARPEPLPAVALVVTRAFEGLPEKPSPDDISRALRRLTVSLRGRDALDRANAKLAARDRIKDLGVAPQDAQQLVTAAFQDANGKPSAAETLQGTAVVLRDPEPWPEPVDGAEVLDEAGATIRRYIVLPDHAAVAAALWVMMTYCIAYISVSPRVIATSPTKICGKTRFLTVVSALVRRALAASSISPAVFFRVIEASAPTLVLDEVDNARLNENDELRALLNSGHTRATAAALRTVGDEHEPRAFSTWCCVAFAAIGNLPDPVMSRAIVLEFQRKRREQKVDRLREDRLHAQLEPLRRKLARWASDNGPALADADPEMPPELADRQADNWGPLLAIADAIGGDWPRKAREAALALSGAVDEEAPGVLLLADLAHLFGERETDRLTSSEIVAALATLESRPWSEWGRSRDGTRVAITPRGVARLLRPFGIEPGTIKLEGGTTFKGYLLDWFKDAFASYLPPNPSPPSPPASIAGEASFSDPSPELRVTDTKGALDPHEQRGVTQVTDTMPLDGQERLVNALLAAWEPVVGITFPSEAENERYRPKPSPPPDPRCRCCGGRRFWRHRSGGALICELCHPPAGDHVVAERIDVSPGTDGGDNGALTGLPLRPGSDGA